VIGIKVRFVGISAVRADRSGERIVQTVSSLETNGELEEAERMLREALAIRKQEFGDDSHEVAGTMNNLAGLLEKRGEPEVYYPTGVRNFFRVAPREDMQGIAHAILAKQPLVKRHVLHQDRYCNGTH
jgi:hypothetical protein